MVHNFKGKLLLSEDSPAEQRPGTAMLNMGRMESPLEKYIASQVSMSQLHSQNGPLYAANKAQSHARILDCRSELHWCWQCPNVDPSPVSWGTGYYHD